MKKYAIFLPQFHEIPENNEWWGEGFTEWTNVKKGKPLFPGHHQPIEPLNDNYYNLLDKKTMQWQTDLMKNYSIDGFIYYHYYFDGDLLLEKPAENLLRWKDIDQPFFFCWANHSWYRSWDGTKKLLKEQTYGNISSWERHFDYLTPFFKDSRYVKIGNKPVFMLFISDFPERDEMLMFFDFKCKEIGFDGIYFIQSENGLGANYKELNRIINDSVRYPVDRIMLREPETSRVIFTKKTKYQLSGIKRFINRQLEKYMKLCNINFFDGDELLDLAIKEEVLNDKVIRCLFFSWDNTARHSKRGYIINPVTKAKVFEYLNYLKDQDMIVINAWNEWCEGMVLEPTKREGYKYLEWIKEWSDNNE